MPWYEYDDPVHGRLDLRRLIVAGILMLIFAFASRGAELYLPEPPHMPIVMATPPPVKPVAVVTPVAVKTIVATHSHRCNYCGTIWNHNDSSYGSVRDHSCPRCGRLQWNVYQTFSARRVATQVPVRPAIQLPRAASACPT